MIWLWIFGAFVLLFLVVEGWAMMRSTALREEDWPL